MHKSTLAVRIMMSRDAFGENHFLLQGSTPVASMVLRQIKCSYGFGGPAEI